MNGSDSHFNTSGCPWPSELVQAAIAGKSWAKYFDVDDFMIVSRLVDSKGTVTHYKHRDTRRYINIADDGTTYTYDERHFEQATKRYGYSATQRLRTAVQALGLWEMPWLNAELQADRMGFDYENRWKHPNAPKSGDC